MEVVAQRVFEPFYMWLDIAFLVLFIGLLLFKKKYTTIIVGVLAGILYQIVDFGIFHLATGSRHLLMNGVEGTEGQLFWVLMWMSMSYGFTNFAWIWLWISRDKNLFEWTTLILGWWLCCPLLTKTFGPHDYTITIWRETGAYHGWMALILFVGYVLLFVWNMSRKKKNERVNIPWLLIIGILVQAGWEIGLYLGGIRSANLGVTGMNVSALSPMIINSLLETNLGMPYIYIIFIAVSRRYTESLKRRKTKLGFTERIVENNAEKVKDYENISEFLA